MLGNPIGDPVVYNLDTGQYYPPGSKLKAQMAKAKSKANAPAALPLPPPVLAPPPAAAVYKNSDPLYDFLDEEVSAGSGIKVKAVAFGLFAFVLIAAATGGRR